MDIEQKFQEGENGKEKDFAYCLGIHSSNDSCLLYTSIVRSTQKILQLSKDEIILLSENKDEDIKYGLSEICTIREAKQNYSKKSTEFWKAYLRLKFRNDYREMDKMPYRNCLLYTSTKREF